MEREHYLRANLTRLLRSHNEVLPSKVLCKALHMTIVTQKYLVLAVAQTFCKCHRRALRSDGQGSMKSTSCVDMESVHNLDQPYLTPLNECWLHRIGLSHISLSRNSHHHYFTLLRFRFHMPVFHSPEPIWGLSHTCLAGHRTRWQPDTSETQSRAKLDVSWSWMEI